jgi:hypothetical protein
MMRECLSWAQANKTAAAAPDGSMGQTRIFARQCPCSPDPGACACNDYNFTAKLLSHEAIHSHNVECWISLTQFPPATGL